MNELNSEPVYLALTRDSVKWGVHYFGWLFNFVVSGELIIGTGQLIIPLSVFAVLHLIQLVICWRDPGLYHDLLLWGRTYAKGFQNGGYWGAVSFSPSSNVG